MVAKSSAGDTKSRSQPKKSAKNSLVANINRRKKAGTSRSKSHSTISENAYSEMQKGWPKKAE